MIEAIFIKFGPYVIAAIAAVAAYIGIRQSGKVSGRREAEQEQARADAKTMEKAREIDAEIDALGDDDLDRRGRRWVRNDKQ